MRLKLSLLITAALLATGASAQHEAELDEANNNVRNTASLQRGARYFVNYCMGCHSAQYVRYNRLAEELQLTEDQLLENLMFTGERPFDTMSIAMGTEDAERWFGVAPPDLSLIARSRGTDYIYTFLQSFYADESSPTGVDNLVLAGTSMPHVLWELQGIQEARVEEDPEHEGEEHTVLALAEPGTIGGVRRSGPRHRQFPRLHRRTDAARAAAARYPRHCLPPRTAADFLHAQERDLERR